MVPIVILGQNSVGSLPHSYTTIGTKQCRNTLNSPYIHRKDQNEKSAILKVWPNYPADGFLNCECFFFPGNGLDSNIITWEETTVLDRGRGQELLLKEALHIQMTPPYERLNRDGGLAARSL